MPTQWYYQRRGEEHGPVGFRELAQMIREDKLGRDDLVRSDWDETWQWADSVPGLFYVAQRPVAPPETIHTGAVETANEAERAVCEARSGEAQSGEAAAEATQPGWLKQLLSFRTNIKADESRTVRAARSTKLQSIEGGPAGEPARDQAAGTGPEASRIGAAAKSALDAIERRESRRQRRGLISLLDLRKFSVRLALVFPWACSLAAGNAAAYATVKWSEAEALRFPSRDPGNEQWSFPLYGDCGALEYTFLLGNVALLAAVLGYGLASVLQAFTDE